MASKGKTTKKSNKKAGKAQILITGFPGFLASRLVKELLEKDGEAHFSFLVIASMVPEASRRLEQIEARYPSFAGRWSVFTGDITDPLLGLTKAEYDKLVKKTTHVWHLAAIYDLAVGEEIAYRVNVMGTVHVLDFCQACAKLARLNYVSTCYVSGERKGTIYENELDEGQAHKNFYEATKFWAEVEVQRRMDDIPTVIFRPGITVGDSKTGETEKYDGPYYFFTVIHQLPRWLPIVNIGRGDALVNIVPIDFVARAMVHIGTKPDTDGKVYQIADPNPMRSRDIMALILSCMDRPRAFGRAPSGLVERTLGRDLVQKKIGIPQESLIYFNHDARYDSTNTQRALQDSDVRCPHLSTYMQTLVDYFLLHPDDPRGPSKVIAESPVEPAAMPTSLR
ncbi:MAG: SDR family oxidoreductase [Bradymonadaceae bacterium]